MIAGRLASMVAAGVNPVTHPFDILLVRGGVDTATASIGALAALAWTSRDHLPTTFDLLAPAAVAGVAGWHAGCLWRGTCLGTATDLPWGMTVEGSSVLRHPVELYTAAVMIVAAAVISRLPARPLLATGAGLTAVAAARLVTEPLRLSVVGGPVATYLAGAAIGIILVAVSIFRRIEEE
jgi:prolipoprotein diacylglyceryltransferase